MNLLCTRYCAKCFLEEPHVKIFLYPLCTWVIWSLEKLVNVAKDTQLVSSWAGWAKVFLFASPGHLAMRMYFPPSIPTYCWHTFDHLKLWFQQNEKKFLFLQSLKPVLTLWKMHLPFTQTTLKYCLHLLYPGSRSCQIYPFLFFCAITALIKPFRFMLSFPTQLSINLSSPSQFIPFPLSLLCHQYSHPQGFWLHCLIDKNPTLALF